MDIIGHVSSGLCFPVPYAMLFLLVSSGESPQLDLEGPGLEGPGLEGPHQRRGGHGRHHEPVGDRRQPGLRRDALVALEPPTSQCVAMETMQVR